MQESKTPDKAAEHALRNTVSLLLTGLIYLLFHLRLGPNASAVFSGTLAQMLLTTPYAIGFTCLLLYCYRRLSGTAQRPAWSAVARIFLTMGILFAFFFALYEYGGGKPLQEGGASAADFWRGIFPQLQ